MSILNKLTEGIVGRDLRKEGDALLNKWEKTGLLEGIDNDVNRQGMARLLENQASQLLKEASSMAAGDVEGFASVAFPLVRRVFGGLLANDIVSVQPMSLPSGLIFFLDFTFEGAKAGYGAGESIYGGNVVGKGLVDGVTLGNDPGGFYNLQAGYASSKASVACATPAASSNVMDGSNNSSLDYDPDVTSSDNMIILAPGASDWTAADILQMSAKLTTAVAPADTRAVAGAGIANSDEAAILIDSTNGDALLCVRASSGAETLGLTVDDDDVVIARLRLLKRHTKVVTSNSSEGLEGVTNISQLAFKVVSITDAGDVAAMTAGFDLESTTAFTEALARTAEANASPTTMTQAILDKIAVQVLTFTLNFDIPLLDNFDAGNSIGSVVGNDSWGLEEPTGATGNSGSTTGKIEIPEIDIKVDSVAVTAVTKKLKAKWSPELGQDLNAYHNLDAEVELTSILSEQIALEIDREILNDLVKGANAGTYYWSRSPGLFLDRVAGTEIGATSAAPDFTGTVSEWYETLVETINDVSAQIHRKTLRGGANFIVVSPEVANILEFTAGFRASITADDDRGTVGAVKSGSISKKWDVYVDPYFPRNLVLVGRKGGSFLESGYVYAPYVPLQVTPTIFGTEDFVPRKGVMTRYAKKMVRPDMYGLVIVRGILGEAGA
jgi:hypothetical protein